jgi:S-formylglutathione hydrolase
MSTRKRFTLSISTIICISLITLTCIAQDGRIVRETIYSPSLEGNLLGDSPNRPVTIYLPPSYDKSPEMAYPVVYLLHGYTGNNELWTGGSYIKGNILDSMKAWLNSKKVKEMILVMPNSYNKFAGSWYTNSIATGNWADYIAKDLVKYMDKKYRTLPQRESRGVIGHSMGGYGGMKLGMLYPDLFGCIGGISGSYFEEAWDSFADIATIKTWAQYNSLDWTSQLLISMCAAFSPNPDLPPLYFNSPYEYTDTNPRTIIKKQEAFNKFLENSIIQMVGTRLDILLNARAIYIDCGTNDGLIEDARLLHDKLNNLGVKHIYKEFSGDHTCCVMNSTGDALEVF